MKQQTAISVTAYGGLAGIAAITFVLPRSLTVPTMQAAGGGDDMVRLVGTVRDFRATHTDFGVVPTAGLGHYAGTVGRSLDPDGRPTFNVGRDESGPVDSRVAHWTLDDGTGTTVRDELGNNDGTVINGAAWTTGHGGGGLHFDGMNDYVEIPSSPDVQVNGDITFAGWFKLDVDFDATSPATMVIMEKFLDTEHDFHVALAGGDYNRPEVPKGTLVFKVENGPTSDYYRYTWTNRSSWTAGVWYHFAAALVSSDTALNRLFIDGVDDTNPIDAGGVGFVDTDYDAPMRFGGKTIDYNGFATDIYFRGTIDDVMIFDRALTGDDFSTVPGGYKVTTPWLDAAGNVIAPHAYNAGIGGAPEDACGDALSDVAGGRGPDDSGAITDAGSFGEWYRDVPGVNASAAHAITLKQDVDGVWSYLDDDFHPVDGRVLGNDGDVHNEHFTYHIGVTFAYGQCASQFVEFEGGDGAWLFVDGELVIDLGGVQTADGQRIDLDRLGLTDGATYSLDLFYAHRNATSAVFRLRTNLDLAPADTSPTISAMFD